MLDGANPYGIGYAQSVPPGAPFAYGPVALLWYLPAATDAGRLELLLTMVLLAVFALRGRPLGLALYATLPALLVTSTDGSNDTSAGVLLLIALLAAQRRPVLGAALLAVAVAFKPYALAWLLPLLAYGGIAWPLLAFVATSMVAWGWAVVAWGPMPILDSLRRADSLHPRAYYSLAWVVERPSTRARRRLGSGALRRRGRHGHRGLALGAHRALLRAGWDRRVPRDPVHGLVVDIRVPGRPRAHRVLASGRLARPWPSACPLAGRPGRTA